MEFQITNSQNIISVVLGIGNYLEIKQPVSLVMADFAGSVGKYLLQISYPHEERLRIHQAIQFQLNTDFSQREAELFQLLNPLLQLLKNGRYKLQYHRSFLDYQNVTRYDFDLGNVYFAQNLTDRKAYNRLLPYLKHQLYLPPDEQHCYLKNPALNKFQTSSFYSWSTYFVATEPRSRISRERVKHFKNRIAKGKRPFAIILNGFYETSGIYDDGSRWRSHYNTANYILDGHHKLVAYHELKIAPPIVEITYLPTATEFGVDFEKLARYLYPWHVQHLIRHWSDKHSSYREDSSTQTAKEHFLQNALQNPESPLQGLIRHGRLQTFHPNGQLKYEANYQCDQIEGMVRLWHPNKQLANECMYKNGKALWGNSWFPNGQLQSTWHGRFDSKSFNEVGLLTGLTQQVDAVHYTSEAWHDNGVKSYECLQQMHNYAMIKYRHFYPDGRLLEHYNWNL